MPIIKTAILLGYKCNNNCRFCYCADKRDKIKAMPTHRVKEELEKGHSRGSTFVDFLGGEPTIRKDLVELIAYAKEIGYKNISITTNGRMLSNKQYAKGLIDAGLNSIVFSIHGHKPELHDYLTRAKGSFDQCVQGMKNVKEIKPSLYLCTNTVMVKPNLKFLPKIAENNVRLGADAMEFIFPHPRGNAWKNFEEMVPRLSDLIGVIPKTIDVGIRNGIAHTWMRYVPACYMIGYRDFISEYASRDKLQEQHIGPEFQNLEVEQGRAETGRVKGVQCWGCKRSNICEGIWKEYADKRGFSELIPRP